VRLWIGCGLWDRERCRFRFLPYGNGDIRLCFSGAYGMDQGLGLWGRLNLKLLRESPRILIAHAQGRSTISQALQQLQPLAKQAFVVRIELRGTRSPAGGKLRITACLVPPRESHGRLHCLVSQPLARAVKPVVEFRCFRKEEALQKFATVQLQRLLKLPSRPQPSEFNGVAPEPAIPNSNLVITPGHNHPLAKAPPKRQQGAAERCAGTIRVGFRPKEWQKCVAPDQPIRALKRKIGEQGNPLRAC
jgi:hypothetical protein